MVFGTSPVWRISANLGFTRSQAKQGIKLICLSAALGTSSLSLRNHIDYNLSIYLPFFFWKNWYCEAPWEWTFWLPCLDLRGSTTDLEDMVRLVQLISIKRWTPSHHQSSQICQTNYTQSHSLTWFCQNNLLFVANDQRNIGKEWKKNVPFCWLILL